MRRLGIVFLALAFLAGCGLATGPSNEIPDQQARARAAEGSIFGEGGITFGGDKGGDSGGSLGVNGFLWRASLATISFFPLSQADPFGGVIITDWYTPPSPCTSPAAAMPTFIAVGATWPVPSPV